MAGLHTRKGASVAHRRQGRRASEHAGEKNVAETRTAGTAARGCVADDARFTGAASRMPDTAMVDCILKTGRRGGELLDSRVLRGVVGLAVQ